MSDILNDIRERAKSDPRLIILPEKEDERMRQAAEIITKSGIAKVILLDEKNFSSENLNIYAQEYYNLRQHKGITMKEAQEVVRNPLYYAAMMVRLGEASGFVAGASNTTPNVTRAAMHCLGIDERLSIVSSCFIITLPDCLYGEDGVFFFADCGVIPEPTERQLALIAVSTAELAKKLLDFQPRLAMLSYSTKGSALGRCVEKVRKAVSIARELRQDLCIDGELQLDAAIVPEVARLKDPQGTLKGKANILIFPNLEAGNICYKLVQRLAKGSRAVGPILQGLNYPCSDLSRGCDIKDIIDAVAVTVVRAQQ